MSARHLTNAAAPARACCCAAVLALAACAPQAPRPSATEGLEVEAVEARSPAAEAGLRPGDRLLSWAPLADPDVPAALAERGAHLPRAGRWRHALEWRWVEAEYGERGGLRLEVWRSASGAARVEHVRLRGRGLGLRLRPALGPSAAALLQGEGALRTGQGDASPWRSLARAEPDPGRAVWLALRLADALAPAGRDADVHEAFELALHRAGPDPLLVAYAHDARGEWLAERQRPAEGQRDFEAAWQALTSAGRPGLAAAEEAADVGIVCFDRGALEPALEWSRRAWHLRRALAPGSLAETASLTNLGAVELRRGDLAQAQTHLQQALTYAERQPHGAAHLAPLRLNLGAVAYERGDWDEAERHWQAGLELRRRLEPGSLGEARALNNLGRLAFERGEHERASDFLRRSLELRQARAPDSLDVARALHNLADAAAAAGQAGEAESLHRRALELRRRLKPASLDVAESLTPLALLAARRGASDEAQTLTDEAARLLRRHAPGSLLEALVLTRLAHLAEARGRMRQAEAWHLQALARRRRLAPASAALAESLHALGRLARVQGRHAQARAWLQRALDALESQAGRLGGADSTSTAFAAQHARPYEELVDLLARDGQGEAAFDVSERWRARALLALVAARRAGVDLALPAEQARERRQLVRAYEQQRAALAHFDARTPARDVQAALQRLRELGARREALARSLVPGSVRASELGEHGVRRLREILPVLDPGTLLVAFVVTPAHTWALAVLAEPPPPAGTRTTSAGQPVLLARLPLGEAELSARVAALRDLAQNPRADSASRAALDARLLELGEHLCVPLRAPLARSRRLLLLPDGALHTLPFAALRCDLHDGRGVRSLAAARPLHVVASAAVYAGLVQRRRERPWVLAAFGRPLSVSGEQGRGWRIWTRGWRWGAVRDEVRELAALFPGTRVYLGAAASEARAKSLGPEVTHVHFAGHASADERLALDAYLELAPGPPPDGDDGRLRAWEVMEELRLDAELVTLAACETGLGRAAGGEGLVGLVRAFQWAGARSLLASLWRVDDRSSAALMRVFYGRLRTGLPKDEALRAAQLELLAQPEYAHPFHWAGFVLVGDRR